VAAVLCVRSETGSPSYSLVMEVMAVESIDYAYISQRFIVTCSRCTYTVKDVRNEKEGEIIAAAHVRHMNDDCGLSGHYCAVGRVR